MIMQKKTGILLVNLGTPDSPEPKKVHRYLTEFLLDKRVIDSAWPIRQLLVRGIIIPARYKQSAKAYKQIWTEEGSPLKIYGYRVKNALQERLGENFHVELAMRYQQPSIPATLLKLKEAFIQRLIVLPLFPQYCSATTGSVHQKVMNDLSEWENIPETILINSYQNHPSLVQAFCKAASKFALEDYDHVLFSFHGLPERYILKADSQAVCKANSTCCQTFTPSNQGCYSAQCYVLARSIAQKLKLNEGAFSISFQSRLGKEPWLQPYTSEVISKLAKAQKKRILVFCPSFVCDCLETIYEIGVEYSEEFKHAGGERLDLVPGLNDSPEWVDAIVDIVNERIPK
jgi:ferrochelatase